MSLDARCADGDSNMTKQARQILSTALRSASESPAITEAIPSLPQPTSHTILDTQHCPRLSQRTIIYPSTTTTTKRVMMQLFLHLLRQLTALQTRPRLPRGVLQKSESEQGSTAKPTTYICSGRYHYVFSLGDVESRVKASYTKNSTRPRRSLYQNSQLAMPCLEQYGWRSFAQRHWSLL